MRYRYQVNLAGGVYLGITLLVGVAATIRPNNILVWVFGLLLALIAIGGLVSGASLYRMSLRRIDPGHGRVGRPMVVRYVVRGGSNRLPLFDLSITERAGDGPGDWSRFSRPDPAWLMHAAPDEAAHAESVLIPDRRGRMCFDRISATSSFPFGLLGKSVGVSQPMETLVHPHTVPIAPAALDRLLGGGGNGDRSSRRPGHQGEFMGLREYRSGDSVRSIAWKRWRQDDSPVVVQRASPSPRRVIILLDLRRATNELRVADGVDPRAMEETAITLAGSIAETGIEHGIEVGLRVAGAVTSDLPTQGGRRHLDRLLAGLGAIELDDPRDRPGVSIPPPRLSSLVVIHVDRVDPSFGHDEARHLLPESLDGLQVDPAIGSATRETPA